MGMLDLWPDDVTIASRPDPREGKDLPATFGETFADAWSNGQLAVSGIKQENARTAAVAEYVGKIKEAGGDFDSAYLKQSTPEYQPDPFEVANGVVEDMKAKGKPPPFQPMTEEDIGNRAVEISRDAIGAHEAMGKREQTWSSWLGGIAGEATSAAMDPYNIPMMAVPLEGLGILGTAAVVGGSMAATQTASEAANQQFNERVQPGYVEHGGPMAAIIQAGLGGAALGFGGAVLGKGVQMLLGTAAKDTANIARSQANIDETNVLLGIEGEAAHQSALAKAIDDILKERPVNVSNEVGRLEPVEPPPVETPTSVEGLPPEPLTQPVMAGYDTIMKPEPKFEDAIRADLERAIDMAAQKGKALQIPIDIDKDGNPVFASAASALGDIDRRKALADTIEACATGGLAAE